jgi:hypothetical protein
MSHAALRTILPVAGWNTERARAVEITRVADPSCGNCAPGVDRRSRSIPGKRPPRSAAGIT